MVEKQSKSLPEAMHEYQRRYQRSHPPGFVHRRQIHGSPHVLNPGISISSTTCPTSRIRAEPRRLMRQGFIVASNTLRTTHELVPIWPQSKLSIFQDLIMPSPDYKPDTHYNAKLDPPGPRSSTSSTGSAAPPAAIAKPTTTFTASCTASASLTSPTRPITSASWHQHGGRGCLQVPLRLLHGRQRLVRPLLHPAPFQIYRPRVRPVPRVRFLYCAARAI
ncbi:MAG: hypothetical protein L6R35_001057 [Caloplaca aegaea]|nr:MAG: hypothetical protein L6R35_001057 [Caloplaca aegaea]